MSSGRSDVVRYTRLARRKKRRWEGWTHGNINGRGHDDDGANDGERRWCGVEEDTLEEGGEDYLWGFISAIDMRRGQTRKSNARLPGRTLPSSHARLSRVADPWSVGPVYIT